MNANRSYRLYVAALIAAPLLVLATQDNSLFTRASLLDPWVYLGFFRDFVEFKRSLFPPTYYGSRFAWVLPGAALHSIFGAVTAAAVLHLLMHVLATVSLFFAIDALAGKRAAFLTALLFAVHPWVWEATGWDYVDGSGIAYCLLSMALFTRAALRPSKWLLAAAGAAASAAVYTNLFWAPLSLLLPLSYLGLARDRQAVPLLRAAVFAIPWVAAGALLLTAAFSTVNYLLDGHFNFYAPSVGFALWKTGQNPYSEPFWTAQGLGAWLWFPLLAALTALWMLPARLRRAGDGGCAPLLLTLQCLLAIGFNSFMHWFGSGTLGLHYYASYMLPFTFAVIGISYWPAAERIGDRAFLAICAATAVAAAVIWSDSPVRWIPAWPQLPPVAIVITASCIAAALVLRARTAGLLAALTGFLLLTAEVRRPYPANPHANRRDYAALVSEFDRITALRKGQPVLFWLDSNGGFDPGYTALASTYLWEYSMLGSRFPNDGCGKVPLPQTLLVVTTRRQHAAEAARAAIAPCWSDFGLLVEPVAADRVEMGANTFTAAIFRALPDPAHWHPLRLRSTGAAAGGTLETAAAAEPMPLGRWRVWTHQGARASLRTVADGVEVRTPPGAYQYAITYPTMVAPVAGRYRFALRYFAGDGSFAFGAYTPADMKWRSVSTASHGASDGKEMAFSLDLQQGETVDLLIANNREGGGASTLVIRDVTAVVVTPAVK